MHLPLPRGSRICCNLSRLQVPPSLSSSTHSSSSSSFSSNRAGRCACGCRNSASCSCSCCVHPSSLSPLTKATRSLTTTTSRALFRTSPSRMAQEYKLKDISSLADIKNMDKVESEVEGVEGGKVLVLRFNGQVHAMSPKCTHYGAPLKLGVVAPDGRITCPWHGGKSVLVREWAVYMLIIVSGSLFQYWER